MNTILILKPFIDALYDEMKEYKDKTDKRIKELEAELSVFRNKRKRPLVAENVVVIDESDDDEAFAEAARAPPASSPAPVLAQVEPKKGTIECNTNGKEDVKNIKMIGGKDAKEYMKEYQRTYRKKQKGNTISKTNA